MVFKIFLVLPAVLFVESNLVGGRSSDVYDNDSDDSDDDNNFGFVLVRGISIVVVLSGFLFFSFKSTPFLRDDDDKLDKVVSTISVILAFISLIVSIFISKNIDFDINKHLSFQPLFLTISSSITDILNGTLFLITVFVLLSQFEFVGKMLKSITQTIDLSNEYNKENWTENISKQRKFELWYPFWDYIFENDHLYRIPAKKKYREKLEQEYKENKQYKQQKHRQKLLNLQRIKGNDVENVCNDKSEKTTHIYKPKTNMYNTIKKTNNSNTVQ